MSEKKDFIKISELTNWTNNPRDIDDDKFQELKNRIKRHGQFKPVIVNSGKHIPTKGEVLGGNMRLKAFRELGIEDIWVSVVHPKSEAEKIEIALTDNEELGYYEDEQLAELVEKYQQEIDLAKYAIHLDKPLSLDEILNEWFLDRLKGNIVLDLFLGSGSTLIACEQTNRICYGMELDPKYCDVIRKRYHKFVTGSEDGWIENTQVVK